MLPAVTRAAGWHDDQITLVDASRYLYYSGMVPEYLGGVYATDQIRVDLASLSERHGVTFRQAHVDRIDADAGCVFTARAERIPFDVLALDVGVAPPPPPPDAHPVKPFRTLRRLRAELDAVGATSGEPTAILIAGGGAAGTEIGLNLAHRFRAAIAEGVISITLVETETRLLPQMPARAARWARELLRRAGVVVRTETALEAGREGRHVCLSDGTVQQADFLIWAAGTQPPDLAARSDLPTRDHGFLAVSRTLQVEGMPHIFAAGDCARIRGYEDLARVGVHAVKQGETLAHNLDTYLRRGPGAALQQFRPYPLVPLILSTGTPEAIWSTGRLAVRSRIALLLKHWIDRRWIRTYQSSSTFSHPARWLGLEHALAD